VGAHQAPLQATGGEEIEGLGNGRWLGAWSPSRAGKVWARVFSDGVRVLGFDGLETR
jgi:hypothetical protein